MPALLIMGFLATAMLANAGLRVGLAWNITPSPDGSAIVYLAERRIGRRSEHTLTVISEDGTFSLTPRYGTVVAAPSGKAIAYRAHDSAVASPVCIYGEGTGRAHPYKILSLATAVRAGKGERIQWSSDSAYLRFRESGGLLQAPSGWKTVHAPRGGRVRDEDELASIEWAEPTAPAALPAYMTQERPTMSAETFIVWGSDSKTIYVTAEDAVWRVTQGEPYMHVWQKLHEVTDVQQLLISPSRTYIVVEAGVDDLRTIQEIKLDEDPPQIKDIAEGWGVRFADPKDVYYYANYSGFYGMAAGGRTWMVRPASSLP